LEFIMQTNSVVHPTPLPLGKVIVVTRGVSERVDQAFILSVLNRHRSGDWGDVCESDARANNAARRGPAEDQGRILSVYLLPPQLVEQAGSDKVWVITEWDRSVTTVLFPSEY
jgi:hypothetical protein